MDIKDVEKLAELARIELSTEEKESMLSDMKGILEYVKVIEGVEVEDITPDYKVHNVWREDLPASGGRASNNFSRDSIIEQFPESKDGFLKVKKIL